MLLRKSYLTVLKDMLGMTITRALSIRLFRGSYAVATAALVAMRGSSASATAMVLRFPAIRSELCCLPNSYNTSYSAHLHRNEKRVQYKEDVEYYKARGVYPQEIVKLNVGN